MATSTKAAPAAAKKAAPAAAKKAAPAATKKAAPVGPLRDIDRDVFKADVKALKASAGVELAHTFAHLSWTSTDTDPLTVMSKMSGNTRSTLPSKHILINLCMPFRFSFIPLAISSIIKYLYPFSSACFLNLSFTPLGMGQIGCFTKTLSRRWQLSIPCVPCLGWLHSH